MHSCDIVVDLRLRERGNCHLSVSGSRLWTPKVIKVTKPVTMIIDQCKCAVSIPRRRPGDCSSSRPQGGRGIVDGTFAVFTCAIYAS